MTKTANHHQQRRQQLRQRSFSCLCFLSSPTYLIILSLVLLSSGRRGGGLFGRASGIQLVQSLSLLPTTKRTLLFTKQGVIATTTTTSSHRRPVSNHNFGYHNNQKQLSRNAFHYSKSSVLKMSSSTTNEEEKENEIEDPVEKLGLPSPIILGSASFTRKLILKEMGVKYSIIVRPIDEKGLGDRGKDVPSDLVLLLAKAKCEHLVNEIMNGNCCGDSKEDGYGIIDMKQLSTTTTTSPSESKKSDGEEQGGSIIGGYLVLTGDQVVTHNDEILEKPESIEEAKDFVRRYGQSPPSTVGSCVITHIPSMIQVSGVDTATIHFKPSISSSFSSTSSTTSDSGEKGDNEGEEEESSTSKKQKTNDLIDRLLEDDAPVLSCAGGLMIEHPYVKEHLDYIDGTEDSVMGLSKDLVQRLLEELATKLKAK